MSAEDSGFSEAATLRSIPSGIPLSSAFRVIAQQLSRAPKFGPSRRGDHDARHAGIRFMRFTLDPATCLEILQKHRHGRATHLFDRDQPTLLGRPQKVQVDQHHQA